jgi:tetratricopeptide (TPR) repeat protein
LVNGTTRRRAVPLATLAALTLIFAAYANFFHNSFHFDDSHVVETNLFLRSLKNAPRFFTDANTFSSLPANATYRPLTTLSLALDYAIGGGLRPEVFHASQLLFLLVLWAALVAFYRTAMDRCDPRPANAWLALGAATFFAVHTANTETLNLMHCRSEILSALGLVVAFLIWWKAPRLRRAQAHLVAVAAGALAKVPAVLFGPLVFVWEALAPAEDGTPRPLFGGLWRAAKLALPATVVGAALFLFTERMNPPGQTYGGSDRWAYAMTQTWAWLHYLRLFVLPTGLTADTDMMAVSGLGDTRLFAGAVAILGLAAAFFLTARRERAWPIAFGIAWFALGLLPTSSIVPLAEPVNEHRVFLPFIGLTLAAAWALGLVARGTVRTRVVAGATVLLLLAHAAATHVRNRVWRTEETLWADVTQKSPQNGRAWMNYGLNMMTRGDYAKTKEIFDRATTLVPNYYVLAVNRAILANAMGDPAEAERQFQRAIVLGPDQPASHSFFANWLVERGRGPEALAETERAASLSPALLSARELALRLLAASGDRARLVTEARALLTVAPDDALARAAADGHVLLQPPAKNALDAFHRGVDSGARKEWLNAALADRAALELDPSSADALNNLGFALGNLGFFRQAVPVLEEAVRLRPDYALARNNLAWVRQRAESGR